MHTRPNSERTAAANHDVSEVPSCDLERIAVCAVLVRGAKGKEGAAVIEQGCIVAAACVAFFTMLAAGMCALEDAGHERYR